MERHSSSNYEPVFLVEKQLEDTTQLLKTGDGVNQAKQPRLEAGDGDPQMETPEEVTLDDVNCRLMVSVDEKNLVVYRFIKEKTIEIMDTANRVDPEGLWLDAKMTFFAAEAMALLIGCEYKSVILKVEWASTGPEIVVDDRIESAHLDTQFDNESHFQRLLQKLKTLTECRYALHSFICETKADGLGTVLIPVVALIVFRHGEAHFVNRLIYMKTTEGSLRRLSRDLALTIGVEDLLQVYFAKVDALAAEVAQGVTRLQQNVD